MMMMAPTTLAAATSSLSYLLRIFTNMSRKELLELPGLGPSRVEKILQVRNSDLSVRNPERLRDLMGISGIGASLLTKIPGGHPGSAEVAKYVMFYEDRFGKYLQGHPRTVVSLDLGIVNSAFCSVNYEDLRVTHWEKINLELPKPYSPEECYAKVKKNLDPLPSADLYIVEEQSHRNPLNQGFLGISVQLRTLEAMVHAVLRQRDDNSCVRSIPARQVAKYFNINGSKKSTQKKKAATKLVTELVTCNPSYSTPMSNQPDVPKVLVEYFMKEKKKDDLSDCLLQALALMEWRAMTLQIEKN